jgi:hypothetical protein
MNCPQCNTPYDPGAAFCDNCGAALPQPGAAPQQPMPQAPTVAYPMPAAPQAPAAGYQPPMPAAGGAACAQCGTPLTPGAAFCDNCGAPVGAAAPQQPPVYPQPQAPMYPQQPPAYQQPQVPAYPQQPPVYQPQPQVPVYPQPVMGQPRLVVQATNAPITIPPGKVEYMIGREDPVSNIFPDVDMTPHGGDEGGVSRRHARLFQQGGQWFIEDYNTTNFTYVNNQKVQPGVPVPVQSGAELRFGRVKVVFYTQ